jgi:polysaccharide export outer membrane protein
MPLGLLLITLLMALGAALSRAAERPQPAVAAPAQTFLTNTLPPPPEQGSTSPVPGQSTSAGSTSEKILSSAASSSNSLSAAEVLSSIRPLAAPEAMEALDKKHKLAIGDQISFRIVEDEEDSRPLVVTDVGDLEIPYIGRFQAAGRSCHELARLLKLELERDYYYQATVLISVNAMARARGKVYIVGPVRIPGPLELPSDEVLTVSKAILRAGGFGDFADRKRVKVSRRSATAGPADVSFVIDVGEILEKGKSESDLPLEPGDLIYVPERLVRF